MPFLPEEVHGTDVLILATLYAGDMADGEEALKVARSDKPDLIIMDLRLPKVSGLEVTRQLRQMSDFRNLTSLKACSWLQ